MYYGYNDKELILADEAFVELLGYTTFQELSVENILPIFLFFINPA